jgi:hypothetical protein
MSDRVANHVHQVRSPIAINWVDARKANIYLQTLSLCYSGDRSFNIAWVKACEPA